MAIVVEIIASNDVWVSPDTTDGTRTSAYSFVEACSFGGFGKHTIVDVEIRYTVLRSGFSSGNALALKTFSGIGIEFIAVIHPSEAAITRPSIGFKLPLAVVILYRFVDLAICPPIISDTLVSFGAIAPVFGIEIFTI